MNRGTNDINDQMIINCEKMFASQFIRERRDRPTNFLCIAQQTLIIFILAILTWLFLSCRTRDDDDDRETMTMTKYRR